MRILVVDDDVDFADGMSDMLALFGHDVETAYSCNDGIIAAGKKVFELALIDVGLADRNGAECARGVNKIYETVTCVLVTGYSADVLARMGVPAGEFDILRKPIRYEDLARYLND